MRRALLLLLVPLVLACPADEPDPPGKDRGLLGQTALWPYPSMHLLKEADTATGYLLDLNDQKIPVSMGGNQTPTPLDRLRHLDGFPAMVTAVVKLDGFTPDESLLPHWDELDKALSDDCPVALVDLDQGVRWPFFAELDHHPHALALPDRQVLMVRPLQALPPGAHVAVVLTRDLLDANGQRPAPPTRFQKVLDGEAPDDMVPGQAHYDELFGRLDALGFAKDELLLAWDWVVGTPEPVLARFDAVLGGMRDRVPIDGSFDPSFRVANLWDSDQGDPMHPDAWRILEGWMTLPSYVDEDGNASLDSDGLPVFDQELEVYIMAMVPQSLRGADPGTAPVMVFGHGLLAHPNFYLSPVDDPSGVIQMLNENRMIAIATEWRGLTLRDTPEALNVAIDFGTLPVIPDRLHQGIANALMMERLPLTGFADLPFFAAEGGGSLMDPDTQRYFGISLGGIEGTVFMANQQRTPHGVLHVPGSTWSTMLERSTNWNRFEPFVEDGVPDPQDRQLLYALSQFFWDPVDPITHAWDGRLDGVSALWQMSLGDEEVPNFTCDSLLRTAGIPLVQPGHYEPWGLATVGAPTAAGARGVFQFDPQPDYLPPRDNRPAEGATGAHQGIRRHPEHRAQLAAFFQPGAEGTIIAPCGDQPCTLDNTEAK